MGKDTAIQWCDATFNPWRGCTKVSPGCANCYAETLSKRNPAVLGVWGDKGTRVVASESKWKEVITWNRLAANANTRQRVFCASLADVFEDRDELIPHRVRLFHLINETPSLDWLLLTKRPENIRKFCKTPRSWAESMPLNVWLGTTIENQEQADKRIPILLKIPAKVRFLSVEPMICPINLSKWFESCKAARDGDCIWHDCPQNRDGEPQKSGRHCPIDNWDEADEGERPVPGIHWVIVGGESGSKARPFDLAWARSIRDQCKAAGVAFFMKQMGVRPHGVWSMQDNPNDIESYGGRILKDSHGGDEFEWPEDLQNCRAFPAI